MSMTELIEVTRRYGGNPDYVLAGGGNTSLKQKGVMYVKASGTTMGEIDETGFVQMDQARLDRLWTVDYPVDQEEREERALEDLMKARLEGETARPSVETLLHCFVPFKYVVHTHPAMVNGMTCSRRGQAWAEKELGDRVLWIPVVNPGYILAKYVKDRVDERLAAGKKFPDFIMLQNHGVFTGGDTIEDVDQRYQFLMGKLEESILITPDMAEEPVDMTVSDVLKSAVQKAYGKDAGFEFMNIRQCRDWLKSPEDAALVFTALTPDHIVYMGHEPLWIPEGDDEAMTESLVQGVGAYEAKYGKKPKTLLVQNQGIVSCGVNSKEASLSGILFRDAVKVAVLSENFGGIQFMPQDKIDFINTWEVEKYRAQKSI
ncbi:class II aldolase/adducin family protein [Oceanispirochaeta sp.]|jgi:rhamnose utilization protein RhaD (predicted bifunctional aldolase and dehydrogenase)|uniref:class II aldolase/adducin family protein n=1 Tax=Oceanispirochaeta sp. TaxID=2035350 RepID=UPI0026238DFE|nr:class II aldolase/adducin family protein [Oceanispirochaeta sp.]MDA3957558.1 class II aldolase/adducin family protein [Oceanispirochaeta sp.]